MMATLSREDEGWVPTDPAARIYAERALRTQRFTLNHLGRLAGSSRCASSSFLGFGRNVGSELSDAWYDGSQLMADAAVARLGQTGQLCAMHKTVAFLDLVARPAGSHGFYPRANVDGGWVTTRDTYADDNALIGLALLEARASSTDDVWRAGLLARAENAARFLMESGLWDETFEGGFWWNTDKGAVGEGKPTQTTAVAAQLFARLYGETSEPSYAAWAQRSLEWLDSTLYDPVTGWYRYNLRHWDMSAQSGRYLDQRVFGYDQGILIEVHLLFERWIRPGGAHLEQAQDLARRLEATFWEPERGGFRLEAQSPVIYTAYAAWMSQSLLALHAVDQNPIWLEQARSNLDTLEELALDPTDGAYIHMQYRCSQGLPGCEHGANWSYDPTKLLFTQAWMQRGQAMLAERLRWP